MLDPAQRTATGYRDAGEARVHSADEALDLNDGVTGWSVQVSELFT